MPRHTATWFACVSAVLTADLGTSYCRLTAVCPNVVRPIIIATIAVLSSEKHSAWVDC
jgi:hypothetical protein